MVFQIGFLFPFVFLSQLWVATLLLGSEQWLVILVLVWHAAVLFVPLEENVVL